MSSYKIPFNKPSIVGNELEYIACAIENSHISGDGAFTRQCHAWLEQRLGVAKALLTTSCTHALEMAAFLLDIQPGDEVIVPSFTFVSTINAFTIRGARPVFIDIRPDTLNLNEQLLEQAISPRTRSIVVVHYAGVGCEMDAILETANRRDIPVIEDNAHGLFGKYKGRYLGTFGRLATQSFHETKNMTCGEGGALLMNQVGDNERAEILREKGTNRSRFFRGQVDKYTWVDLGSSYLPSEILAAFLYAQLERADQVQAKRRLIWENYQDQLQDWAQVNGIQPPFIPAHCEQSYHMFYMLFPTLESRTAMIEHLKEHQILGVFHYLPLHTSGMGLRLGGKAGDCPVTEDISDRLLRLPFYYGLSESDQQQVIDTLRNA